MKTIIIYVDTAMAAAVNATLDSVSSQANEWCQWHVQPWRAEGLKLPLAATEALTEAADAHVVVFALAQSRVLPGWLIDWLE